MEEHCTVYFSKSVTPFDEVNLSALLQQSRDYNTANNVTGVLMYVRGSIVQVLEGEKEEIETLFRRIQADDRHTDVTRVIDRLITKRLFGEWTMGYETITSQQMEDIKLIVDFEQGTTASAKQPAILRMIKSFYDSNHYNN